MATKKRVVSLGVDWHLPCPKRGFKARPFTSTTVASSNLINLLAADGLTWAEVSAAINYDDEAKAVADRFITEGHGDTLAATHVGGNA